MIWKGLGKGTRRQSLEHTHDFSRMINWHLKTKRMINLPKELLYSSFYFIFFNKIESSIIICIDFWIKSHFILTYNIPKTPRIYYYYNNERAPHNNHICILMCFIYYYCNEITFHNNHIRLCVYYVNNCIQPPCEISNCHKTPYIK